MSEQSVPTHTGFGSTAFMSGPPEQKLRRRDAAARAGQHVERKMDWHHRPAPIRLGPGGRIWLAKVGGALIILPDGGTKKRQQRRFERAKASWSECEAHQAATARPKGKR
jgi:hypothetical protein